MRHTHRGAMAPGSAAHREGALRRVRGMRPPFNPTLSVLPHDPSRLGE
jgi:hypothetical protein